MLKTTPDAVSYDKRATAPRPSEKWNCFGAISDIILIYSTPVAKQEPRPLGLLWLTFLCYAVQKRELNATQALLYDLLCTIYIHSVVLNSINTFMVNQFISCSSSRARCHRFFNFMLALLILPALCFHPKKGRERDGGLPCLCRWAEQLAP